MNGAEAAASLFGPDDSSSDPFASLGGDNVVSGNQTPDDHHAPALSQDQFSAPIDFSDGAQATPLAEDTSQHYVPAQFDASQSYGHHTTYLSSGPVDEYQTPGSHSPEQYQTASIQQVNASSWPTYSLGSESSKPPPPQNPYNPYAPVSTSSTSTGTYDATSNSPYNSPAVKATPYAHAASPPYNTSVSASYHVNVPPSSTVNVPAPPAPAPASTINRPKVSNAYDPPFPPVAKSKRVVSRSSQHALTGSTSYQGSYAYNSPPVHHAQHQPSIPPLPIGTPGTPFSGMPRKEGPHYPTGPPYLADGATPGLGTVDGLPKENLAYQSAWTAGPRNVNGYHEEKVFGAGITGGGLTYYPSEPSSVSGQENEPRMDSFSSSPLSWPGPNSDNGVGVQASVMKSPSLKTRLPPDYGDIGRGSSPGILTHQVAATPLGTQTQMSPKASVEIHGSGAQFSGHAHGHKPQSPPPPHLGGSVLSPSQTPLPTNPDPYGPPKSSHYVNSNAERRATSPVSQSVRSLNGRQSTKPQPGARPPSRVDVLRGRSMSNGSVLSSSYNESAYVPSEHHRSQRPNGDPGPISQVPFSINQPARPAYEPPAAHNTFAKAHAPYAPSPSLLATNDPLGRTSVRVPVVSFGFGGKLVTCFHGADTLNTGFDIALSSRGTTNVQIHNLSKVIPRSALDIPVTSFPGPLFSDPGASSSSLVRTTVSSQKNKKAGVTKYLSEKAAEISHGLGYLNPGSTERRQAEGKLVLVKLLKIMVENDGRLTGSPSIETSVRAALVPRLDGTLTTPTPEFTTIADAHAIHSESASIDPEFVIAVNTLRTSSLDKIQEFLLRGERRQACHYALDEKLWAHAMIIASSIDKDAWQEVINEFLKAELGTKVEATLGPSYHKAKESLPSKTNGREALRVAYSLYSGQGSVAVQELVPQTNLSRGATKLQVQNIGATHITPRTPNFHPPAPPANIPPETLAKWTDIVAMILSSTISTETSSALTALGDQLLAHQYIEAAHACYLLAPQTSLMGGLGNPAVRIVLLGSKSPAAMPNFLADPEPIIFSEIVEFALSLSPIAKGQEAFAGLPHLQAYRFIRATVLAEMGEIQLANRYCEAITASLSRPSPYFTPTLLDHLRGLADRISGTSDVDKANSWIGGKITKPSLDSIGGWLEGRFTKLVTGDVDSPTPTHDITAIEERTFSGPFSTISSTTPSARSSPQPILPNTPPVPPPRSGSAMASSSHTSYAPVDRASSAMDYYKPKVTSAPRVVSAGPGTTSFSQSQSQRAGLHERSQNSSDSSGDSFTPKTNGLEQEDTWWGGSRSYEYSSNASAKTPTATTFMRVDESAVRTTPDGFISLMDAPTFSGVTSKSTHDSPRPAVLEDVEDLGLGNPNKERDATENGQAEHATQSESHKPAEPEKTESRTPASTAGGSWLSRWWKRDAAPGAIKASLGDESAFYYDKQLKRWVNKKATSDDSAAEMAPPPPPPRAQTASPAIAGPRSAMSKPPITEMNSMSAIDLTTSPPSKSTLRVQSNPAVDSAPSTPTGTRLAPNGPPPGRPRSQASVKRNLRSRYVDVLQPESNAS